MFLFEMFRCIPFCISYFNTNNCFQGEAIRVGSVGKDQSSFGKKKRSVSSLCADRLVLCFFFSTLQNKTKKNLRYPRWKAVSILWSCQYIFIVFYFFSLGMLLWTAVNLYSSCKLIVRKLYRFLYFGRKVFFLCNKRFPILANVNMQWTWVLLC